MTKYNRTAKYFLGGKFYPVDNSATWGEEIADSVAFVGVMGLWLAVVCWLA